MAEFSNIEVAGIEARDRAFLRAVLAHLNTLRELGVALGVSAGTDPQVAVHLERAEGILRGAEDDYDIYLAHLPLIQAFAGMLDQEYPGEYVGPGSAEDDISF